MQKKTTQKNESEFKSTKWEDWVPPPPISWTWDGLPPPWDGVPLPHLDMGQGTPHLDLGWGIPPQLAVWGTPHLDLGWGTPPPSGPRMGFPTSAGWVPPLPKCEQTDTCENSTFPRTSCAGGKYK